MVSAIILMEVRRGKVQGLGEKLAGVAGITEVFSVGGRYDLVALVRVRTNEDLADLVTSKLAEEDDILQTESMIAFKVFSRHDLESMFSIGAV
jgi:DNA-binding Lrp family transcriptional regulator